MDLKTQFIIKNNPYLFRYLRENSYWYKILNRNSDTIGLLEQEMKEKYKMTVVDRIENLGDKLELISNFIDILK